MRRGTALGNDRAYPRVLVTARPVTDLRLAISP